MKGTESFKILNYLKIVRTNNEKVEYDVYEVELYQNNGQVQNVKVFTEPDAFKVIENEPESKKDELKKWFLIDRLVEKNGLLEQQDNSEYIYAGKIEKSKNGNYYADSYICINEQSGKTRMQEFKSDLPYLKDAIENRNVSNEKQQEIEGKNYAISDVHGMYGSYMDAISKLTPKDSMFILGDVVDRGKNGIKIISDIIERKKQYENDPKNNPEITFLCGNHEWLFYRCAESFLRSVELLPADERIKCTDRKRAQILCKYFEINDLTNKSRDKVRQAVSEFRENKKQGKIPFEPKKLLEFGINRRAYKSYNREKVKVSKEFSEYIEPLRGIHIPLLKNWVFDNKGKSTFIDFMRLEESERKEVMDFILNSDVLCSKELKGGKYLLVHAMPPKTADEINEMVENPKIMKDISVDYFLCKRLLEERTDSSMNVAADMGYITICGHTPHERVSGEYVGEKDEGKLKYIDIDTGCGHHGGRLTFYCMDTGEFEYIEGKEDIEIKDNDRKR